ncbi:hypothetical protein [Seonamhaeicola maritimus]|uniref:Lipoprotein n=1 Tax=Seonamhaeicola maritimus TaxID=2591822 RepID=A0A5C7GDT7_9FLAO|nr:hypothetical protein [Seonamhaeicola maritimus]TXG34851.1 hypothetical protein FUA22_17270 [Seonamhaeicola maritimus]
MKRLLTLFLTFLLFGCTKELKKPKNGLTKSINEIIEYTIQIQKDSVENEIRDTLLITTKKYGKNDNIVNQTRKTLFDNQQMQIDYIYNSSNRLKKEIVKMSTDSLPLIVNYIYKDTLLYQSSSIVNYIKEKFEQVETHYYRNDNTKQKSIMTQIYVDTEFKDTIRNSLIKTYFDKGERVDSILSINLNRQGQNRKTLYEYDGNNVIGLKEFNQMDSLISSKSYEYKMDKFDNWIEKKIFEIGLLKTEIIREIKYK